MQYFKMMNREYFLKLIFTLFLLIFFTANGQEDGSKRPFYVVGHMINSIPEVKKFLNNGANVLESDIMFYPNGSVQEIYHGPPCDCFRNCNLKAKLSEYLDHIRKVTDPAYNKTYSKQMIFQFFDLKLKNVNSPERQRRAGKEMADQVLDHLWDLNRLSHSPKRRLMKVLLYVNTISDAPTIAGFQDRFVDRGHSTLLKNVGYDGGVEDGFEDIENTFRSLGIGRPNLWQGDGIMNCLSAIYPDHRLKKELIIRDDPDGYINKVYHWTIDLPNRIITSLKLGVDGMITNVPEILIDILKEEPFVNNFRIATIDDDPFVNYEARQDL